MKIYNVQDGVLYETEAVETKKTYKVRRGKAFGYAAVIGKSKAYTTKKEAIDTGIKDAKEVVDRLKLILEKEECNLAGIIALLDGAE